jgi:PAS domain S-box-containing protein
MNNQAEKLLGWDKEKMLGKIIEKSLGVCRGENEEIPCEEMAACRARKGKVHSIVFDYNRDGEIIKIEDVAAPISLNGEIIGVVDIMRDVTREKEVERAQREFVSIASHQLRTPTSTIAWHTELLLSDDLTKQQKELVEEIYQQNSRMRDLINALLNVSRIDLGKLRFLPQKMNIAHALELVLNDQKLMIGKKHIKVTKAVDLNEQITNDPIIVQVILDNLVSNAVKYTPSEGDITIRLKPVSEETFQIQVKDTGMGIPNEEKSQIFSRLFRASNAKDKEPDGHGLGLYAVKTMVVAMGGKIWFETKLGQGTTFFVELPRNLKIQDKA